MQMKQRVVFTGGARLLERYLGEGKCDEKAYDLVEGLVRLVSSPAGFIGPADMGNASEYFSGLVRA